jgi:hypothetical protein
MSEQLHSAITDSNVRLWFAKPGVEGHYSFLYTELNSINVKLEIRFAVTTTYKTEDYILFGYNVM